MDDEQSPWIVALIIFINPDGNMFSKTLFQYHRTQNDPRSLEFYRENFRFLKP